MGAIGLRETFLSSLRTEFSSDFFTLETAELQTYGRDWTRVHAPDPSVVCFPRTTEEVSRLLKLCSQHGIQVVPSGGRTGLAGGAIAAKGELVLSLARMSKMGPVDPLSQTVRVQAGAITEAVHHHCEKEGLTWPVDFASKGSSHVGGNISTNAGGVKVIRYGLTRQWVLGLQVVLMSGEVLELNGALEKNNTGVDLRQLFIGSEGTLGVVTEATLKLTRVPGELNVFFFGVAELSDVFKLFLKARQAPFTLMAFETLTQGCLDAVCRVRGLKSPFAEPHGAYVLMEVERPQTPDAQALLDAWLSELFDGGLVQNGTLAQSPREAKELWVLREGIAESLSTTGHVHKNDIALPISETEVFISEMDALFKSRHGEFEVYLFGHIGDGNLHINTMKPASMDKTKFEERCLEADKDLFALVQKHRGSVSAEHGIGLLKKSALQYSRTPAELVLMRGLKALFDPAGLLNPGKILD